MEYWRDGVREEWKNVEWKMEGWKDGRMEEWKNGVGK
jgi:hypothetical protein